MRAEVAMLPLGLVGERDQRRLLRFGLSAYQVNSATELVHARTRPGGQADMTRRAWREDVVSLALPGYRDSSVCQVVCALPPRMPTRPPLANLRQPSACRCEWR